ncbi:hypothetical protein [Microbacterium capsulatum]|uniref:Lipoprotein n=1 Tax=Microbacterium capsulatum TaxID=3041921 RepID=A0ABU0XHZ0_9MICO|nr:hypothetical protein [Microbacterium sp. ASV81]MDQ4214751.1 hypothetical protein [Microbacterium sp. ASV81]
MNRTIQTALVTGMLLASLTGCAAANSTDQAAAPATSTSSSAAPSPAPTSTPTPYAPPVNYQLQTSTQVVTGTGGYKQTVTVKMGKVIAGTDAATLTAAWAAVSGGSDPIPCLGKQLGTFPYTATPDVTGFAYGTITFVNNTPSFPAKNWGAGLNPSSTLGIGVDYLTGASCDQVLSSTVIASDLKNSSTASWSVPFVIAVPNYQSPSHPTGDPSSLKSFGMQVNGGDPSGVADFTIALAPLKP